MSQLLDIVYSHYSGVKSVDLCDRFFNEPDNLELLNDCYYSVLPILGIIVRNHFKTVQDYDLDDMIQLGAIEYWNLLANSETKPRPFSVSAHFNLYYKVGIRSMLKAMEASKSKTIDFFLNNALPPVASWNFRNPEQEVFSEELPHIIYDMVVDKMRKADRFKGTELEVCEYIAHCKVFKFEINKGKIRSISGKITNSDFFIDYVSVMLSETLHDLKESMDISKILQEEGESLKPMYYSGAIPKASQDYY